MGMFGLTGLDDMKVLIISKTNTYSMRGMLYVPFLGALNEVIHLFFVMFKVDIQQTLVCYST